MKEIGYSKETWAMFYLAICTVLQEQDLFTLSTPDTRISPIHKDIFFQQSHDLFQPGLFINQVFNA